MTILQAVEIAIKEYPDFSTVDGKYNPSDATIWSTKDSIEISIPRDAS